MSEIFNLLPLFQISLRLKDFFHYLFLITPILYFTFLSCGRSIFTLWSYRYIHKQEKIKIFLLDKIVHYRKCILLLFQILSNSFFFTFILGLLFFLLESTHILPVEQEYSTKMTLIGVCHCIAYYCLALVNQLLFLLSYVNQKLPLDKRYYIQLELHSLQYFIFKIISLYLLPFFLVLFKYPFFTRKHLPCYITVVLIYILLSICMIQLLKKRKSKTPKRKTQFL